MTLFPNGVTPSTEHFDVLRGMTFRRTITLFEDEAKTKPLNLTGLTVKLTVAGDLTLTSGSGLVISPTEGKNAIRLTPTQTTAAPANVCHYVLTLEESSEEIVPPLVGNMTFQNP
jgi:hypothetical protein